MTSPISVFRDLARDEALTAGRFRAVDARWRAGKRETVLYASDFDAGFDNWTDHWDGYRPWPIASLTHHAAPFGARSLMLSTSEGAYTPGDLANTTATFRRTTRPELDGATSGRYQSVSGWFGLGIGNFDGSWGEFGLLIDTNRVDNTGRNFFRLLCNIRPYPDASRWQIAKDSNSANNVNIPNTTGIWHGDNDNKTNFGYVRLTIDRLANSGAGGYHEAQIGPRVFSLTGLGGGSAPEPLQDSGTNISRFNGGDNIGLTVSRNTGATGGCQLFAGGVVVSTSDEA